MGSYLQKCLQGIGVKVLVNDPPKEKEGDSRAFTPFEQLIEQADIITVHTPIVRDGENPTYHLFDKRCIG